MTKKFAPKIFLLLALCLIAGSINRNPHEANQQYASFLPLSLIPDPIPTYDSTLYVQNETSVDVGWLNVQLWDSSFVYLNINSAGNFSIQLSTAPYICSIHGQSFTLNNPRRIYIDAHTSVMVSWVGNYIGINQEETY